jgi:hypothetical protein
MNKAKKKAIDKHRKKTNVKKAKKKASLALKKEK